MTTSIQQIVDDIITAGQTYSANTAVAGASTAQIKIIMPMIRHAMPGILAQQITGVQPMSISAGRIFSLDLRVPYKQHPKYKFSRNWFIGRVNNSDGDEVHKWCKEMFGNQPINPDAWCRWYRYSSQQFYFRDVHDYEWFMLRWS